MKKTKNDTEAEYVVIIEAKDKRFGFFRTYKRKEDTTAELEATPLNKAAARNNSTGAEISLEMVEKAIETHNERGTTGKINILVGLDYIAKAYQEYLPKWKANGWRKTDNKPIAHLEKWKRIQKAADESLAAITILYMKPQSMERRIKDEWSKFIQRGKRTKAPAL